MIVNVEITVFTPTYNRAYIINRLYESLQRQEIHNFEWLVVDDGSVDETEELFRTWMNNESKFPIRYYKKKNGGKCRAINFALDLAKGKLFFVVDSDDYLTDDALKKIIAWEKSLPKDEKYCGVAGNLGMSSNFTPNTLFETDYYDGTLLDRYRNIDGERALAFFTEIHKKYRYPEYSGEKFMTEAVIYNRMANHGCEAIVRSTVSILNEKSRLYSLNADKDLKYGLDTICDIKRDTVTVYPKKSLKWFISAAQTKISGKIDLAVKIQRKELLKNIISKEIFLSIGGDNYCYPGTDVLAAVNRNIKKKGAKLVLWGCSVEPKLLKNPEIVADLKEFDLITARESISYNALKTININTVKVADPAFTLPKKLLSLPDNWLERNMVGINASPLILQNGKDSNTVYMAYRMLIQEILDHTDCGVALIPHVVCDGNNDLEVLAQLYDEFKDNDRIMLIGDHNCMELKGYIARCRFFVGARTHATIAAYSSCVPTLVLGYSVKSRGIARDLFGNEENYVLPVQSLQEPDELTKHFRWLVGHEKEIKDHLEKIMPEYISKAYSGKMALDKLVR